MDLDIDMDDAYGAPQELPEADMPTGDDILVRSTTQICLNGCADPLPSSWMRPKNRARSWMKSRARAKTTSPRP